MSPVGIPFQQPKPTPLKINGWNMSSWRFGSDDFPFDKWAICSFLPLIFQDFKNPLSAAYLGGWILGGGGGI